MIESKLTPRTPLAAWLSVVLGIASIPIFLLALPTFLLGIQTIRTIHGSEGKLRGVKLVQIGLGFAVVGVALAVIGLAAMLIVKVQSIRLRLECGNQLREIGVGLNKYVDAHDVFPPATREPADLPPEQRLSWMLEVLPLCAEGTRVSAAYRETAAAVDRTKGWDDSANERAKNARIRLFQCPAHPGSPSNLTYYVGMTGINPNAIDLSRDSPLAGIFGNDRGVRRQEITAGISFTIMVVETANKNGPWLAGGFPSARGVDPDKDHYTGPGRAFGGLHQDVTMILWADGSVRSVTDSTPGSLFRQQVTIRRN